MEMKLSPLLGMTLAELKGVVKNLGMPAFTAGQLARWMYVSHVTELAQMTNISKAARERLAQHYMLGCSAPVDCQRSVDGTVKYLYRTEGGTMWRPCLFPMARGVPCVFLRKWAARWDAGFV